MQLHIVDEYKCPAPKNWVTSACLSRGIPSASSLNLTALGSQPIHGDILDYYQALWTVSILIISWNWSIVVRLHKSYIIMMINVIIEVQFHNLNLKIIYCTFYMPHTTNNSTANYKNYINTVYFITMFF